MPHKPMLSVQDLISYSKTKGIQFNHISESAAEEYLTQNNNYFKLTSYRKNYQKFTSGIHCGTYQNLDFAFLIELARIDVEIRHVLLKMCLDIEHFLKVSLIKAVENQMTSGSGEDGYKIVTDFMTDAGISDFGLRASHISKRSGSIARKINQNRKNPYCEGLISKYQSEMPIWAFVEMISFGDLKDIIEFYSNQTGWSVPVDLKSLDRVRQIRNAAAHNNCIINDLDPSRTYHAGASSAPRFITQFVSRAGISKGMRDKKLSNQRINQIVHLLYVYDRIVTSKNTRQNRLQELRFLMHHRMVEHKNYFQSNLLLTTTYQFFEKLIDSLPLSY